MNQPARPRKSLTVLSDSTSETNDLREVLASLPSVKSQFNLVIVALRRRQLSGAHPCAKATMELLRAILGQGRFVSADHMMKVVRLAGKELVNAAPSEFTIGNLVKRVLFIIREEYAQKLRSAQSSTLSSKVGNSNSIKRERSGTIGSTDSNSGSTNTAAISTDRDAGTVLSPAATPAGMPFGQTVFAINASSSNGGSLSVAHGATSDFSRMFPDLRTGVMAAVIELNEELDSVYGPISELAQDHIHADECILTLGYSTTVEMFLKAAARKRRFQVIIAEGSNGSGQELGGHKMASNLSKLANNNISTTLIPDSGIYAIMSRVNKVIFAPQAVMADGGVICSSGHAMLAIAAKEFSVPLVGVTGTFLLTPLFSHNQSVALSQLLSPATTVDYQASMENSNVEFVIPAFDHVPPELIDLFVTNNGCHLPSYIYRLLSEYYHPNDYTL